MKIELEHNPNKDDVQAIRDNLETYNFQHTPPTRYQALTIFIRDEDGALKGGLLGGSYWDWLHIDILWLHESIRHAGYGTQLLMMAEEEAHRRGCIGIFVDTMSFQAPQFYIKHGYEQWGQLDDFPTGHQRIFFKKRLS